MKGKSLTVVKHTDKKCLLSLNNLKDGSNNSAFVNTAKRIYQSQGFKAFYRGMMPGMMRSIFANGFSMVAYQGCQRLRLDHV